MELRKEKGKGEENWEKARKQMNLKGRREIGLKGKGGKGEENDKEEGQM